MNSPETIEEFNWKGITIRQKNDVFKVGTDALLLGAWVPKLINPPALILDAGTGTGVLALMMNLYFPKSIIFGMDKEESACILAGENFTASSGAKRLNVRHENILDVSKEEKGKYDLVICNPPFYKDQYSVKNPVNERAKHSIIPVSDWLMALFLRLDLNGHLMIIVPADLSFEWIHSANQLGSYVHHRLDVFGYNSDPHAKRSLLHFRSSLVKPIRSRLTIYEKQDIYTTEYLQFTEIQPRHF